MKCWCMCKRFIISNLFWQQSYTWQSSSMNL